MNDSNKWLQAARERWPSLNRKNASRAGVLLRRAAYLDEHGHNDHDAAEVAALRWAMEYIDLDEQRRLASG